MDEQTSALLDQISALSQQIRNNNLNSDTMAGVLTQFRHALEGFKAAEEELRCQNEGLAQARAQLEAERRRYQELFEFAPDAYLITQPDGQIEEANQAAADLLGVETQGLVGLSLLDFVSEDSHRLFHTLLEKVARVYDLEISLCPREGPETAVSLTLATVFDDQQQPSALRWMLRDITERRQARLALDESERRFRAVYQSADVGILLVNLDGRIIDSNVAFQDMLGYGLLELRGRPEPELCFSQDESQWQQRVSTMLANGDDHSQFEKRLRAKNGQAVWVQMSLSLLRSGNDPPETVLGLARNITAERQVAEELAEMRRRLLESTEMERLRLAQELHDGPLQDMYGSIFLLSEFRDPERQDDLDLTLDSLRSVAGTLRTICGELRPPTLSNLGLERAIRSHADRLTEQHPELEISLSLSQDRQELPEQTRLALYRIYQQCMANVLRHAHAQRVMVSFHLGEHEAALDVWDDGRGFQLPDKWVELLREGHYGLAGVAERVDALGGTLQIESSAQSGTLIHVVVPRH